MSEVVAVGIVSLSRDEIKSLHENGISCLNELMVQRDLGLLNTKDYDDEILAELLDVCKKIDEFNNTLYKDIIPNDMKGVIDRTKKAPSRNKEQHAYSGNGASTTAFIDNSRLSIGVRGHVFESIKSGLVSVINAERPTSLRKAILEVFSTSAERVFDCKTIKKMIDRKYRYSISINPDSIRFIISSLESHGFVRRVNAAGNTEYARGAAFNEIMNCIVRKNLPSRILASFAGEEKL